MKKTIVGLLMILVSTGLTAQAAETNELKQPLFECALTFKAHGGGIQLIVGSFKLQGPGKIHCRDIAGNEQEMNVKVTLGGSPVAPNIAFGTFKVAAVASGIGVASGPEALLGTYYTAGGRAAFIIGAGTNLAVHGGSEALTLNLGLSLEKGVGLQVGLNRMKIEAAQ